jgi:hypothetical protein
MRARNASVLRKLSLSNLVYSALRFMSWGFLSRPICFLFRVVTHCWSACKASINSSFAPSKASSDGLLTVKLWSYKVLPNEAACFYEFFRLPKSFLRWREGNMALQNISSTVDGKRSKEKGRAYCTAARRIVLSQPRR